MRQAKKQEEDYTHENDGDDGDDDGLMNVDSTPLSNALVVDILRIQESTIMKVKERLSRALNRV